MKLSIASKLLLFSLVLLALPWLGFRYLQEMRDFVLKGQEQAQTLAARAIASALQGRDDMLATTAPGRTASLYVYSLPGHVEIDGYSDDWGVAAGQAQHFSAEADSFSLLLGSRAQRLYALIDGLDQHPVYRYPGLIPYNNGDHLRISTLKRDGQFRRYLVSPEGPGPLATEAADSDWRRIRNDGSAQVMAAWRARSGGYSVELGFPSGSADSIRALNVIVADVDNTDTRQIRTVGSDDTSEAGLHVLIHRLPEIERILARVGENASGIWVVDAAGWVRAGGTTGGEENQDAVRLSDPLVQRALQGQSGIRRDRHEYGRAQRIVVAEPVRSDTSVIGAVVLERNTGEILFLQLEALQRVTLETLVVLLAVVGGLLVFAWRLTWRIRRLGTETNEAIDAEGRICTDRLGADAGAADELGGLSRRISDMLGRLRRYTGFLERMPRILRHEINNPLNVITTSLHNVREKYPAIGGDPYLQSAERAVQRMGHIVQGMTEAASLEEALRREARFELDLAALVAAYTESQVVLHRVRRIRYGGPQAGVAVRGNDLRIEQMLDKLFDNALEFTPPEGEIAIQLATENGWAVLRVLNDGPPIADAVKANLFDSMTLLRGGGVDGRPHLGIGLFIARSIAEFHGGSLTGSDRDDGPGAVFTARLPVA